MGHRALVLGAIFAVLLAACSADAPDAAPPEASSSTTEVDADYEEFGVRLCDSSELVVVAAEAEQQFLGAPIHEVVRFEVSMRNESNTVCAWPTKGEIDIFDVQQQWVATAAQDLRCTRDAGCDFIQPGATETVQLDWNLVAYETLRPVDSGRYTAELVFTSELVTDADGNEIPLDVARERESAEYTASLHFVATDSDRDALPDESGSTAAGDDRDFERYGVQLCGYDELVLVSSQVGEREILDDGREFVPIRVEFRNESDRVCARPDTVNTSLYDSASTFLGGSSVEYDCSLTVACLLLQPGESFVEDGLSARVFGPGRYRAVVQVRAHLSTALDLTTIRGSKSRTYTGEFIFEITE